MIILVLNFSYVECQKMSLSQIIGDPILGGDFIAGLLFSLFSFIVGIASSALGIGGDYHE